MSLENPYSARALLQAAFNDKLHEHIDRHNLDVARVHKSLDAMIDIITEWEKLNGSENLY